MRVFESPQAAHPVPPGRIDLAGEVVVQAGRGITRKVKVTHLADIAPLNVAEDHGRVVVGDHAEEFVAAVVAGEVEHLGPRLQAGPGDRRVVRLDRHHVPRGGQLADDRQELRGLGRVVDARGMGERGLRADVQDRRPLRRQDVAPPDGGLVGEHHALSVPGVGREVDHPHEVAAGIAIEPSAAEVEGGNPGRQGFGVAGGQFGEILEAEHGNQRGGTPASVNRTSVDVRGWASGGARA
jgi:hypothetical protein